MPLPLETVNIQDTLTSIIRRFEPRWQERQLSIKVSVSPIITWLRVNPTAMETVLRQLLLNAIHFNRKGGHIQITVKEISRGIEIAFSDTGIGIPLEKQSKVFDRFYQAADYLTREVGGVGLGLALVKRLVILHRGTITVQSHPGEGSTFTITLPTDTIARHD